MEYDFRKIEKYWQEKWKQDGVYKVSIDAARPKCYVLDMFPYPSGAGLHVGHPLGYIASDIYARYKRLKGFNVLHPMGYDAFGLPAEQYAIDHGIHPAISTENNINTFRKQLDNIGFSYDWDREVRTCDPKYYKWTQWIFLQLFNSFYNRKANKAEPVANLIKIFEAEGNQTELRTQNSELFSAEEWKRHDEKAQQDILMQYRLAYCGIGEVNWCEALGTVLANDEVMNGVSERGGHPVEKKKLRQWYLRITEYADRLLEGLEKVDFSESMKEMQSNWIGKSSGAEIEFEIRKPPLTPPKGEDTTPRYQTALPSLYSITKKLAEEKRNNPTPEENTLWQLIRGDKTGFHIRRQHIIGPYIVDFACLDKLATIEIDGGYHRDPEIKKYDEARTAFLKESGFTEMRFSNEQVKKDAEAVVQEITKRLSALPSVPKKSGSSQVSPSGGDLEGALKLKVYTTRPDTIFGVDFMVIAPEHELVEQITTAEQKSAVDKYITYVKIRSERERMAEKKITGVFTGAYALNPFNKRKIPIWISEYVLIGYGTGAIMAVPCGDQRDFLFAKHFNIPITNIIGSHYNGEEANPTKDAILENSDFLNGIVMKDAIEVVIGKLENLGPETSGGKWKVNYKMRDAAFSRQRYWGEPFPIVWKNGIAYPLPETELPVELPHMDELKPGPDGEGPLANLTEWTLIPNPSPQVEKGAARVPKYVVHMPVQYGLAKEMRKGHTEAERKMWEILRNNNLGVKFRRQHPIEAYIVDFICLQEKLVVEVDGGYHQNDDQKSYDEMRTKTLRAIGFEVIRFSNDEVINNIEEVKEKIRSKLAESANNSPLRLRRGVGGEGQWVREVNTMPGYAGSSWYFLRYMDPHNEKEFCSRKASDYWGQVDLYIGGTEHAVGHLLYSRMWTKCLFDLGYIGFDEPYKKLVNQGMITAFSYFAEKIEFEDIITLETRTFICSFGEWAFTPESDLYTIKDRTYQKKQLIGQFRMKDISTFVEMVTASYRITEKNLIKYLNEKGSDFVGFAIEDIVYNSTIERTTGEKAFSVRPEIGKMSKSKHNVENPDNIVEKYGADTFRMYEMFLGPVEMSKPWDTKGIEGVFRFLRKFWRLFADEEKGLIVTNEPASNEELKVLHNAIRKIENDTERFSFNTAVSSFMIATNELTGLKCHKRSVLEPLLILLAPYAPHIAEDLYNLLWSSKVPSPVGEGVGGEVSILNAIYPQFEEKYVKETSKAYPVAINGKTRTELTIALDATQQQVEEFVLKNEVVQKWLEGKPPKKVIYVKNKMINVVV